ncbi:MAG: hypothetical protein VX589_02300 [Myxococcota bacterium]|nr:hypothetical protein [Myxococcota bacterium]
MKSRHAGLLLAIFWVIGCGQALEDRTTVNRQVKSLNLDDDLSLVVHGASILSKENEIANVDSNLYRASIRAQSLDVRIEVSTGRCNPVAVQLELTQIDARSSVQTVRHFYDAQGPLALSLSQSTAQNLSLTADGNSPNQTPIDQEASFTAEGAGEAGKGLKWTICLHQPTGSHFILPGFEPLERCPGTVFGAQRGVCALHDATRVLNVTAAHLVARHRVQVPMPATFEFAVWGNIAEDWASLALMTESVNRAGVAFSIIAGDLTTVGGESQLIRASESLTDQLSAPWYATLGDRDILGTAAATYPYVLGASSFAFDAGPTRVIVLDSADRALGRSTLGLLSTWLQETDLWWTTTKPRARFVITHTPPFDEIGPRDQGFRLRAEGASFIGQLIREKVGHLFTSALPHYGQETTDGVRQIRVGGGQTTEMGDTYWLRVTVDGACGLCPGKDCPCIQTERIAVQ